MKTDYYDMNSATFAFDVTRSEAIEEIYDRTNKKVKLIPRSKWSRDIEESGDRAYAEIAEQ